MQRHRARSCARTSSRAATPAKAASIALRVAGRHLPPRLGRGPGPSVTTPSACGASSSLARLRLGPLR
jgi:hypothetical protein